MALVPLNQLWVDANFKEAQLRKLKLDQPVTLVADVYGGKVEYHGRVAGLGAGTGSAFSLLPAQNATGNWIKVVQRVPVRVALDTGELAAHPLRVGLSIDVKVDVREQGGKSLVDAPRRGAATQTAVFDEGRRDADAAVRHIVEANLGKGGSGVPVGAAAPAHRVRRAAVVPSMSPDAAAGLSPASSSDARIPSPDDALPPSGAHNPAALAAAAGMATAAPGAGLR